MTDAPRVAVILAGGLGTRLRPLTLQTPKGLLPVINRPLLSYELEWLARAGVERVILAVAEHAEVLEAGLGLEFQGMELVYRAEPERLDTAGALQNAAGDLDETFWALNGDLIFDFDPEPMGAAHRAASAVLTIALRQVEDVSAYGLIHRDDAGRVTAFLEKQAEDPTGQNTVNFGLYLMEPAALASVPAGQSYSNEVDLFPGLVASGATVLGYLPEQILYWLDVGRVGMYLKANHDLLGGALPWVTREISPEAKIYGGAIAVLPCDLAATCIVEPGAVVGPYVSMAPGAFVDSDAWVRDCVLHEGARVGRGARLVRVVVAAGQVVPPGHEQTGGVFYCE